MFWDSSAVVPSLLRGARSPVIAEILRSETIPALWWASPVKCQSALYRRRRDRSLTEPELEAALGRLRRLTDNVDMIAPIAKLRDRAGRLLAAYALSGARPAVGGGGPRMVRGRTTGQPFRVPGHATAGGGASGRICHPAWLTPQRPATVEEGGRRRSTARSGATSPAW